MPCLCAAGHSSLSNPCHAGRGLAGHPRSVRVGYGDNKTRLFTPIRSKTPALQRRGLHLGAGRERSRSALRGDDAAGKRSHRNGFSSFERVRLLQPLLPRPQKGWRPPAHPWSQTPESRPHETAVQDDHAEADPLADSHWGLVLFSGPEDLRFAFEGVAYQYTVLPFGLSLAPHTFTKCMDAALYPLRQKGIRILNYLDDWLILAQSEVELLSHRTLILSHLERLGLRVNFAKSALSPSQRISFLGTVLDSAHMRAVIAHRQCHSWACSACAPFNAGWNHGFHTMHGVTDACISGCVTALTPWKNPRWMEKGVAMGLVHTRKGWGALCEGKPTFGHWSKTESGFHINCLEMLAVCSSLPVFPAGPNRTPCADSLRQHVRGVLYKSPGMCLLEAPLYSGRAPSGMGSAQPALAEGSTPAGQTEPRSGYVISEQCPLRGVDAPSAGGSEDLEDLWQGRSRPFRLQRQLSLPNLLFEGQGRVGPRLVQPPPLCIPSDRPASTGRQAYQGTGSQGAIGGPLVEEPTLVVRADSATDSSPLARAPETGSPLSGERKNMAPSTQAVGSLHLEPSGLPERVLNTISEARAPSTRCLYALKWSVFSTWCLKRGENPSTSELAVVLSFLQELLDKGRSHSTLKVFVAAIAAFHAPIAGQSVGRDNSVVRFLKGARRLNPPRTLTVPTWDLPTVLRALKGPPFEPLQSTDLRSLSLKTALLLALASVKRVGDLQALSTSPAAWNSGLTTPRSSWNQGMVTYLRYFQPRSVLRSLRSPRFLRLRRTGSYLCYALSELWESTLSVPPLLGIRNSSLLASVTAPKDIRSRSRDSLSG